MDGYCVVNCKSFFADFNQIIDNSFKSKNKSSKSMSTKKDSDFIKNIVKLQNVKLREIMTPSSVIKSADMDSTIEDFYSKNKKRNSWI